MQSPTVSDTHVTPAPYTQTGALRDDTAQGIASTKSTSETSSTPAPPIGDSVSISQEAREAAEQKANGTPPTSPATQETPPVKEPTYSPIKTVTTSDGTEVSIEASYAKDKNGHKQATSVRVNFTGKDGETYSHTLSESSILTQDENGRWNVTQATGNISGTENDDLIILMPSDRPLHGVTENGVVLGTFSENNVMMNTVNAGEGNNIVVDLSGETTRILTGSGDDTIIGSHRTGRYVVESGAGDDTIELSGHTSYIYSGDGDDNLLLVSGSVEKVYSGSGNDHIKFEQASVNTNPYSKEKGTVDGGSGDDYIEFSNDITGMILGGDGNDTISFKTDNAKAYIDGGSGDDIIRGTGTGGRVNISGGDGDDNIDMNDLSANVNISGGSGDDNINIKTNGGSFYVNGNSGDDYIKYSSSGGVSYLDGGTGDDIINSEVTGGTHYITGGLGDDVIYSKVLAGQMSLIEGDGNDLIIKDNTSAAMTRKNIERIFKKYTETSSIQKEISDYEKQIFDAALGVIKKEQTLEQHDQSTLQGIDENV